MKRALLVGLVAVAIIAGVVVGAVALRHPDGDPVASRLTRAAGAQPTPGWNSAGGSFAAQPVVPPSVVPEGAGTGQDGEVAVGAGDADYVGFSPTRVTLPSGRKAPVLAADVRTDGTLAVPDDPSRLGLWTGGALPGERYGSVVIAGHVDAIGYGKGVLAEMLSARAGQKLTVVGAGRSQTYRIASVQTIVKARLSADSPVFAQNDDARLVLITCGGPFDRATHHYRDNIVVTALPVG